MPWLRRHRLRRMRGCGRRTADALVGHAGRAEHAKRRVTPDGVLGLHREDANEELGHCEMERAPQRRARVCGLGRIIAADIVVIGGGAQTRPQPRRARPRTLSCASTERALTRKAVCDTLVQRRAGAAAGFATYSSSRCGRPRSTRSSVTLDRVHTQEGACEKRAGDDAGSTWVARHAYVLKHVLVSIIST